MAKSNDEGRKETKTAEKVVKISTTDEFIYVVKIVFGALLGASGLITSIIYLKGWWIILGILSLIAVMLVLFKIDIQFTKGKTITNETLDKASAKVGTSGVGVFDLSADTLEIQLRYVLSQISKKNIKVVFVIDELDKLTDNSENLSQHSVFKIIKPLKNLFSLSNATFLFIGADDFFDKLEQVRETNPYSPSYTLFSDRMFLNSMYYDDVKLLVDSYKEGDLLSGNEEIYTKFKAYISWKAKNHIFDTHNLLDDFTAIDDSGDLYVSVKEDDDLNKGNIESDWEIAAGIQAFISATFENRKYPGINRLNEKLYLSLREVGETLYDDYEVSLEADDYINILPKDIQKRLKIENLSSDDRENFEGAIEDLLKRMERNGFVDMSESDKKRKDENNEEVVIKITTFETSDTNFPDESEIRQKNKQLDFEIEFLNELDVLKQKKETLNNIEWRAFDEYQKEFERFEKISQPIRDEGKKREPKSKIMAMTSRVKSIKKELTRAVFLEITTDVVQEIDATRVTTSKNMQGRTMWDADSQVSSFYNYLHSNVNEDDYEILQKGSKYVLLTLDFDNDLQNEYLSVAYLQRRGASSKIINILFDKEIKNKTRQMKWSEIKAKDDYSNLQEVYKKVNDQADKYLE